MSTILIKKPNFFILGAGKSGTTSLYYSLKQHPEIFMSAIKEPTFFCEGFQVVKNPIRYFELFDSVTTETAIGEASHAYLTNPSTARVLKGLFPDAKFIVTLRNPAERAYSLYNQMCRSGFEKIDCFEKALEAEEERVNSQRFKDNCPQYYYNFLYFRSGLYGEQLQRYFSLFDKKQFHILTLEKLSADPTRSLEAIFEFLGVGTDFKPEFQSHNEGHVAIRVPLLLHFWKTKMTWPRFINRFGLSILKRTNRKRIPPMRPETKKSLLDRYQNDLGVLYDLTGIGFDD